MPWQKQHNKHIINTQSQQTIHCGRYQEAVLRWASRPVFSLSCDVVNDRVAAICCALLRHALYHIDACGEKKPKHFQIFEKPTCLYRMMMMMVMVVRRLLCVVFQPHDDLFSMISNDNYTRSRTNFMDRKKKNMFFFSPFLYANNQGVSAFPVWSVLLLRCLTYFNESRS